MNTRQFFKNITEQIKEAQLKLGFFPEVIRLYFPVDSLASLLQVECADGEQLIQVLHKEDVFLHTPLGTLTFTLCKGNRIEVCIPSEGAEYVHKNIADPPFLANLITQFQQNHSLTLAEICSCFAQFNENYVCEKMQPGTDFDYVLYFPDQYPDEWYYCIRIEMGHTIYHRFTKQDYDAILDD